MKFVLIHDINFRNMPRRNRHMFRWGIAAFVATLIALFAALMAAPPGVADLFAYLPPLFALYFLYWGSIVRLENGGIGLAAHWRPPKDRPRDREPGRFPRLLGGLGFLLCWAVCLLMTLEMLRILFSGRLDAMFSAYSLWPVRTDALGPPARACWFSSSPRVFFTVSRPFR